MTDAELNTWERQPGVLNILTSKEFGEWLHRRDKNKENPGEWKDVYEEYDYCNALIDFTCSNCNYDHELQSGEYGWSYGKDIPWRFCPICGKEMRGEKNERTD